MQVVEQFKNNMEEFLTRVFSDSKYLENITALSQYQLIDDAMEVIHFSLIHQCNVYCYFFFS